MNKKRHNYVKPFPMMFLLPVIFLLIPKKRLQGKLTTYVIAEAQQPATQRPMTAAVQDVHMRGTCAGRVILMPGGYGRCFWYSSRRPQAPWAARAVAASRYLPSDKSYR